MTGKAEVKSLQGPQLARKRYGCNVAATQICFDTRRGQVVRRYHGVHAGAWYFI